MTGDNLEFNEDVQQLIESRHDRRRTRKEDKDTPEYARRTPGERDRDRILYSSSLRRLAGITQVVKAGEADVYHNRLTHTLEVAQIGRRMAQYLRRKIKSDGGASGIKETCDPDVVEAACLAHDLGHPPFGHVAEKELDRLARRKGNDDGFEGNAQTFRIVTRLARYSDDQGSGLNLSRATLNAVLKYPWYRDISRENESHYRKYGAYRDDSEAFEFAREGSLDGCKSFEAQIMDHADAIAYAVHDLSDFYKTGILNFDRLKKDGFDDHFNRNRQKLLRDGYEDNLDEAKEYIRENVFIFLREGIYDFGRRSEVAQNGRDSSLISSLINRSLDIGYTNQNQNLIIPKEVHLTINFLKSILWDDVILRPQLATQQSGQIKIIRTLFDFYYHAVRDNEYRMLPEEYLDEIREGSLKKLSNEKKVRLSVDLVARLSESQAQKMYMRIIGIDGGHILERV